MDKILLLLTIPGFGLAKAKEFLSKYSLLLDDDDFFKYSIELLTKNSFEFYMDKVNRIKDDCDKLGVRIVIPVNGDFVDSPLVLFVKGNAVLLGNKKILGVVGTREPRRKNIDKGRFLTKYAVGKGWTTISGLARGCDINAHRETVKNNGKTIAVIPMGYRPDIAPWIIEGDGLIVSEYPPYTDVKKYMCVKRNRIITGYSRGLYVIESGIGGGSVWSLDYACKKGLPISYTSGFSGIEKFNARKIVTIREFDQFLEKSLK